MSNPTASEFQELESDSVEIDVIRQTVAGLLAGDNPLTQSTIWKESGISSAQLSGFLSQTYKGDNQATAEKLAIWLHARERRLRTANTLPAAPDYIETPTSLKIIAKLSYAQMAADFVIIYGGAGLGKTRSIKRYSKTNPNVWTATMRSDTSKVAAAILEIAAAVGVTHEGSAAQTSRAIARKCRDTGGILVIDEAQHLSIEALESVRGIHDSAEIGLCLAGNETVYTRITGGSAHRSANFAQLFSRIGARLKLNRPLKGDVAPLAAAFGVRSTAEIDALMEIAKKPGALRGMTKTLRLASMFAAGEGKLLGLDHILAAWQDLGGGE